MAAAAGHGHLDVVKWLHEYRHDGCTTRAFQEAARNDHLNVLRWFHENNYEGFTFDVMDEAAAMGHFEIVRWFVENRSEWCSGRAMYLAASNGFKDIVVYLFEHSANDFFGYHVEDRCDTKVDCRSSGQHLQDSHVRRVVCSLSRYAFQFFERCMEYLAKAAFASGDLDTLDWLSQFELKLNVWKVAWDAVKRGDWKLVDWLHRHGHDVRNKRLINLAVKHGHLRLVMWFHAQGCDLNTPKCIKIAAQSNMSLMRWMIANRLIEFDVPTAMQIAEICRIPEVAWWLSEDNRVQLVLESLRRLNHHGTYEDELPNRRRSLWWILTYTRFEKDSSRCAIREAIYQEGSLEWLVESIGNAEVSGWLLSTSEAHEGTDLA